MKLKLLSFLSAISLALSACTIQNNSNTDTIEPAASSRAPSASQIEQEPHPRRITSMEELLLIVERNHRMVKKPDVNYEEYIGGFSDNVIDLEKYTQKQEFQPETVLSPEQAKDDLDALFAILQSTYGMYYYWGGDEVFLAAKEQMLTQWESMRTQDSITAKDLESQLLYSLQFLRDGHFHINEQPLHKPILAHMYTQIAYQPYGDSFQSVESGKVVAGIEGYDDFTSLFKLSISHEGELVYFPVVLTSQDPLQIIVCYEDGTQEAFMPAPWESHYEESERKIDLRRNSDIPVIFVRNMGFDQAPNDTGMGKEFLETAAQVKDDPIIMVDLRSNGGGNGLLPTKWFQAVTGQHVPTNFVSINYMSDDSLREWGDNLENPTRIPYDEMTGIGGWAPISDNYMISFSHPDRFVENDRLIILLTGKNTGSAAEIMVDQAHNLQNTLIVGSNTYGMLASNAYVWIYLPNSGIKIQLGSMVSIFPDNYFAEFVGFQPDIWVAEDAEDLVLKMLERYAI